MAKIPYADKTGYDTGSLEWLDPSDANSIKNVVNENDDLSRGVGVAEDAISADDTVNFTQAIGGAIKKIKILAWVIGLFVQKNTPITGATKTKITYDSKGLVTSGADATTADITASTDKNYVTDAQQSALHTSGSDSTLKSPDLTKSINLDNAGVLHVESISQTGSSYETHAEQIYTTKDEIILRDGAVAGLATGAFVGIRAKLYDGVNDGRLVFDKDGFARVGDVGYELKIATIQETPTDSQFTYYDAATLSLKTRAIALSHLPSGLVLTDQTVSQIIGATGSRLTKLWATDGEFTNIPTVGGAAIISSLTDPSFSSSLTVPLLVGGSSVGSNITYKSTTGIGTTTGIAHQWLGGTNGATILGTLLNNARLGLGTVTNPLVTLDVGGTIRATGGFSIHSNGYFYAHSETASAGILMEANGLGSNMTIGEISAGVYALGNNASTHGAQSGTLYWTSTHRVGLMVSAPTALLHLAAGSDVANGAPLKLNSGALTTGANITAGSVEFLTDAFYGTITTNTVRRMFVMSQTGRATAQTAANANVHSFTLPATDGSYQICANVLVTTSSAEAFTVTVAYTDEGNTARTATLNLQLVNGTIGTNIAFANGAVAYMGIPLNIRCKASTSITVATTGTFTGCTYNVETIFKKVA